MNDKEINNKNNLKNKQEEDKKIEEVSLLILNKYIEAFKELAK